MRPFEIRLLYRVSSQNQNQQTVLNSVWSIFTCSGVIYESFSNRAQFSHQDQNAFFFFCFQLHVVMIPFHFPQTGCGCGLLVGENRNAGTKANADADADDTLRDKKQEEEDARMLLSLAQGTCTLFLVQSTR